MEINLILNGQARTLTVAPNDLLMTALRREALFSVKHGCETGECGACVVLRNGQPTPTCILLAAQADGHAITTLEAFGSSPRNLTPLQAAFAETGAIQCGYCTPAQILSAAALLAQNPDPSDADVRAAIAGTLCRCTGYAKPVQAIQRAAAVMRGEAAPPELRDPETADDTVALALGRPLFTDDVDIPGMLYAALKTSPHAHARIVAIDASRARALPGVHAVLTYQDVPRVMYASGGQAYPNPPPADQVSLDSKVRYVGDRVAVVAAESPQIAQQAVDLIEVEYELLAAIGDPQDARADGAPIIHDEPDAIGIEDAAHNIAGQMHAVVGDANQAWADADVIYEQDYRVHQVHQASIEPHSVITYWDDAERLVVQTSTEVPFHVGRMLAALTGLPVDRLRVVKARFGGSVGGNQAMLIEDLAAHLTVATGRPVRFEYTRAQEFASAGSRHPQMLRFKTGVKRDGTLTGQALYILGNTGAYGTYGLTVPTVSGLRGLSTYNAPYREFTCDVVYTNIPAAGAYRGDGTPQALFALETHMSEIAEQLGMDVIAFKAKNWVKAGDALPLAEALGAAREGVAPTIQTCALPECVELGAQALDWPAKRSPRHPEPAAGRAPPAEKGFNGHVKRGVGMAVCVHAPASPDPLDRVDAVDAVDADIDPASSPIRDDGALHSPATFGAQYAEIRVDTETGQITIDRLILAVDCGGAINLVTASGQIEGGMTQALGYAHSEALTYAADGRVEATRFGAYRIYQADDMPDLGVIVVETSEETAPFGTSAVAEIAEGGVAPAIASAIHDATGVWMRDLPFTPERVWRALHAADFR